MILSNTFKLIILRGETDYEKGARRIYKWETNEQTLTAASSLLVSYCCRSSPPGPTGTRSDSHRRWAAPADNLYVGKHK